MDIITKTESETLKPKTKTRKHLARVVRKLVSAKPGLKVKRMIIFLVYKCLSLNVLLCSSRLFKEKKLKYRQGKQKTEPKNYNTKIQILGNPRLT